MQFVAIYFMPVTDNITLSYYTIVVKPFSLKLPMFYSRFFCCCYSHSSYGQNCQVFLVASKAYWEQARRKDLRDAFALKWSGVKSTSRRSLLVEKLSIYAILLPSRFLSAPVQWNLRLTIKPLSKSSWFKWFLYPLNKNQPTLIGTLENLFSLLICGFYSKLHLECFPFEVRGILKCVAEFPNNYCKRTEGIIEWSPLSMDKARGIFRREPRSKRVDIENKHFLRFLDLFTYLIYISSVYCVAF